MKWIAIAAGGIDAGVIAAIMLVGVVGPGNLADGRVITEQDFGSAWLFTVSEGRLRCTKNSVTFEANGSTNADPSPVGECDSGVRADAVRTIIPAFAGMMVGASISPMSMVSFPLPRE